MLEKENMPIHIAMIMDGNRRWAKKHGLTTAMGHKEGVETLTKVVNHCSELKIPYVTVYAFSTENWKRSKEEVETLMLLIQKYLHSFVEKANKRNIKVNVIGRRDNLSEKVLNSLEYAMEQTKNNTGTQFNIAFNYGGRDEIVTAVKKIAEKVKNNEVNVEDINEQLISDNLYTKGIPEPDLLIRTSGELRTSNFLPWQIVYAEYYFTDTLWPDFKEQELEKAIESYQGRNRRFGGNSGKEFSKI